MTARPDDDPAFCPLTPDGRHEFETNDEDGPDFDWCKHCHIWRHETVER